MRPPGATTAARSSLAREVGVFTIGTLDGDDLDDIVAFVEEHGFAIVRGLYPVDELAVLQADLEHQQASWPASCRRSAAPSSSTTPTR